MPHAKGEAPVLRSSQTLASPRPASVNSSRRRPCLPANPGSSRDRQTVAEPEEQACTQWIASVDQVRLAVLERAAEINYIPSGR